MANELNAAIAAVETALDAITTGGGYNYTLGSGEYFGAESVDQVAGGRPRVYIVSAAEDLERFSSSRLFKRISVTLRGITEAEQNRGLRENLAKLEADIEMAMYADKTLGGAVTTLRKTSSTWEALKDTQRAVLETVYELDLHYTEGTP